MEYSILEDLQSAYSDMYKDTNGFRPRNVRPEFWNSETALRAAIADLEDTYRRQLEWEKEQAEAEKVAEARAAKITADAMMVRPLRVTLFDLTVGA